DHLRIKPANVLPEKLRDVFKPFAFFNPMQSKVFAKTFACDCNVLVSAPTGAGKTVISLMAITRLLHQDPNFAAKHMSVFYIAPFKSLVNEISEKLQSYVSCCSLTTRAVSSDTNAFQLAKCNAHIVVTVPEKFDVMLINNAQLLTSIRLVILDEIHIVGQDRGHVIESIVNAIKRHNRSGPAKVRLVVLSATLPNYKAVGSWLDVPQSSIFHFDDSYRSVSLQRFLYGISDSLRDKAAASVKNQLVFEESLLSIKQKKQVLCFVFSRQGTVCLANELLSRYKSNSLTSLLVNSNTSRTLSSRLKLLASAEVRTLFQAGIGVHHAGLSSKERKCIEKSFMDGSLQLLVSTSTLAWGVNLPAHRVIIASTQITDPDTGVARDVSLLDILQMFGRAGRPDYGSEGVAVIMTAMSKVDQYVAQLTWWSAEPYTNC
uniref:Activating signal cointegrator 1 complex subunit 3-like n=1 Tax=Dermatophagoides pteronyssinus TaxID=6956 RepID=A0A6P6Y7D9_DERPT